MGFFLEQTYPILNCNSPVFVLNFYHVPKNEIKDFHYTGAKIDLFNFLLTKEKLTK